MHNEARMIDVAVCADNMDKTMRILLFAYTLYIIYMRRYDEITSPMI